jgi:hypothetical protein
MEVEMDDTTMAATVTCASCGAALAEDQRYCLHCGQAQGDPRVAYRRLIAPAVTASQAAQPVDPPPPLAVAAPSAPPARDWTPLLALGGLAALALVLVVGVLIGKSGTPAPAAAGAPQVITVSGTAPAATTPATTDASAGGTGRRAHAKAHAGGGGGAIKPADAAAGARAVQDLNSATGQDYQRKSARLPDTVALPGKPPPKDNKAPGGGSGAESIG